MQKNEIPHNTSLKEIMSYTLPELYVGKEWYVGFYAFDPTLGRYQSSLDSLLTINQATELLAFFADHGFD